MDRIGGPQAGLMWSRPSQVSRLPGNPVRFPYSQVIPASIPSELSDTEGCERALASAWSLSDEVNLEDQAVRFRCGPSQPCKLTGRPATSGCSQDSADSPRAKGDRNPLGIDPVALGAGHFATRLLPEHPVPGQSGET